MSFLQLGKKRRTGSTKLVSRDTELSPLRLCESSSMSGRFFLFCILLWKVKVESESRTDGCFILVQRNFSCPTLHVENTGIFLACSLACSPIGNTVCLCSVKWECCFCCLFTPKRAASSLATPPHSCPDTPQSLQKGYCKKWLCVTMGKMLSSDSVQLWGTISSDRPHLSSCFLWRGVEMFGLLMSS